MTISFFVNKNDLDQLDLMIQNIDNMGLIDNLYSIECFNSMDDLAHTTFKQLKPIEDDEHLVILRNYIQANIEYKYYERIKEYLNFSGNA